jgi:hypothetical protein
MLALPLGAAPVSGERAPPLVAPMVPPSLELVVPLAPLVPRAPSLLRQLLQADRPSASVSMPVKTTVGYSRFMVYSMWFIW